MSKLISNLFDLHKNICLLCGKDIFDQQNFCDECKKQIFFNDKKTCKICGVEIYGDQSVCLRCGKDVPIFDKAISPINYEGRIMGLVKNFKYGNARYLAKVFSKYMVDKFVASNLTVDVVVPVPMTQKALQKRGYNQAELLAKQVCLDLNLPLDTTNLVKVVDTIQQEKLSMSKRKENLQKAFDIVDKNAFCGKRVLVIDDVKTTGTTLNRIAKLLKKYKAKEVYGLTAFSVREKIRVSVDKKEPKVGWLTKIFTKLKKSTKKH